MDQALIGAGVGASIQVVLQNLLSGPIEQIKLVWDLDEDVTNLVDSLFMIQDFLSDAEMKQINSLAVQRWLHQLEEVAFEADVVLDEFRYELLRQEVEKRNQTSNALTDFFVSGTSNLLLRNEMADKVKKLNKRLKAINKQAKQFGLDRAVIGIGQASAFGSVTPQIQTDSFSVEPNIIGREKHVSKIVDMLLTAPQDETFSVIPILGMGGLGKTTLVQQVYHHESIKTHFDEKIWVCVSVNFDVMTLLKMILEIVTKGNAQECFVKEVVLKKIQESLASKRYLLVLDDVWNENSSEWDSFMSSLKGTCSTNGNCIVVTTRSEKVASNVGIAYRLSSLQEDECWSIIKAKAFSKVDVPIQYEEIGKCIAQRCGGLPLAAKVVGGLLSNKSKDEWESMKNQLLKFGLDDDYVMKILKLSYDHLPSSSSKKCFAYCSVFPQDFKIKREELIMIWMAEGFLQAQGGKDMEAVGDKIFDHFLQNSLFQQAERDEYGNITHCRMHDLVHDLARTISGLITIREDDGSTSGFQARNLAVVKKESYVILEEQAKYIRTISVECKIFDNMFISFKRLHSLKLTCWNIKNLPDIIGELIHLRFLDMSGTYIKHLPSSIGKLYNLQTLLCAYFIGKIPNTIVDLLSLRHLRFSNDTQLPPRIGKLTSLRTISSYKVDSDNGCGIGELGHLKNLEGILEIQNLKMVKNKDEAISANLFRKSNIFKLVLRWDASTRGRRNGEDVLDGLQPHSSLKCLEIHGYSGVSFPLWTMKMEVGNPRKGLHNLVDIKLIDCMHCEEIPMLGHLPCLKFLELNRMSNVQSIGLPFYGSENCSASILFPALEKLMMFEMPKLTELVYVETAITSFPFLESLIIVSCPVLKVFPSYFPRLKHLKVVRVGAGFSLQNICRGTIYLQSIVIDSLPGLACLPEDLFVKNQNLTDLCISFCPDLTHLVRGLLGGGASLKRLTIKDCNNLEELPNNISQDFKQLRALHISYCSGLTGLPSELFDSCASSLNSLVLFKLDNLELETVIRNLWRMNNLQTLIPKLISFPMEGNCFLRSLLSLEIGQFSKSMNMVSFNDFLNGVLHENQHLKYLYLYGMEDWESLPDQIQHLTALRNFSIYDFGIEALPEWLGNLSSLQSLYTWKCKKLVHLPSKEAMQRLTKLRTLCMKACCPLMVVKCSPQESSPGAADNSEWSKISHLKVHVTDTFLTTMQ